MLSALVSAEAQMPEQSPFFDLHWKLSGLPCTLCPFGRDAANQLARGCNNNNNYNKNNYNYNTNNNHFQGKISCCARIWTICKCNGCPSRLALHHTTHWCIGHLFYILDKLIIITLSLCVRACVCVWVHFVGIFPPKLYKLLSNVTIGCLSLSLERMWCS